MTPLQLFQQYCERHLPFYLNLDGTKRPIKDPVRIPDDCDICGRSPQRVKRLQIPGPSMPYDHQAYELAQRYDMQLHLAQQSCFKRIPVRIKYQRRINAPVDLGDPYMVHEAAHYVEDYREEIQVICDWVMSLTINLMAVLGYTYSVAGRSELTLKQARDYYESMMIFIDEWMMHHG